MLILFNRKFDFISKLDNMDYVNQKIYNETSGDNIAAW